MAVNSSRASAVIAFGLSMSALPLGWRTTPVTVGLAALTVASTLAAAWKPTGSWPSVAGAAAVLTSGAALTGPPVSGLALAGVPVEGVCLLLFLSASDVGWRLVGFVTPAIASGLLATVVLLVGRTATRLSPLAGLVGLATAAAALAVATSGLPRRQRRQSGEPRR